MTFSEKYLPVSRQQFFSFFATGSGVMNEALGLGKAFEICDIRLHLSVIHVSTVDFIVTLSAGQGSAYNWVPISARMSEVSVSPNFHWRPSTTPMLFLASDDIRFSMANSVGTVWGLTVTGWAVTG
jgi:hypothetical protein